MTDHNRLEKSQNKEDNSACIFCNNLQRNLESGKVESNVRSVIYVLIRNVQGQAMKMNGNMFVNAVN